MTSEEAFAKLKELLVTDFRIPPAKVTPSATFRGALGLDSLDSVDFIYLVTKTFGVKADTSDFRELHTVQLVADFIAARVTALAAPTGPSAPT